MAREDWLPTLWGGRGDPFSALRRQIDDAFNDFGAPNRALGPAALKGVFNPHIDVAETEKELTVTAELPGLTEADVEVTLAGDVLTIRGEKSLESEEGAPKDTGASGKDARVYHRVERSWGAFQRSIRVPFDLDADKISAEFKNGVLKVSVPKPATVQQQAKKIDIKTGA
ncbi:MAG: Hsp20/alpha crystallin family protein [Hyphomicrobiaceae bacterium]